MRIKDFDNASQVAVLWRPASRFVQSCVQHFQKDYGLVPVEPDTAANHWNV
jgi:hypothetical protein